MSSDTVKPSTDPFMEFAKGRFPLSTNMSAARNWTTTPSTNVNIQNEEEKHLDIVGHYVPRPDCNYNTLWFLSFLGFLGLDHFYLRSPRTGIAKLLTLGGFGLWWLWDFVQLSCEKERVINYGLFGPLDFMTGIGQGSIYDDSRPWNYSATSSIGLWVLAVFFGFTGIDSLMMGNMWLGIRKFFIMLLVVSIVFPMFTETSNLRFLGIIFLIIFIPIIIAWLTAWGSDVVNVIFNGDTIMQKGLPMPRLAYHGSAYFRKLYEDDYGNVEYDLQGDWESLKANYIFKEEGTTAEQIRNMFYIAHSNEKVVGSTKAEQPAGVPPFTIFFRIIGVLGKWILNAVKAVWFMIAPKKAIESEGSKIVIRSMTSKGVPLPPLAAAVMGVLQQSPTTPDKQKGGGYKEESLSTEAQVFGAVTVALIGGGAIKGLVDYLMQE